MASPGRAHSTLRTLGTITQLRLRQTSSGVARLSNDRLQQTYSTAKPPTESTNGLLSGVRILDFTRVLAGPFCTQILADYGADVIKVEQPITGDGTRAWKGSGEAESWKPNLGPMSYFFASLNRNKRSITLDLKKPE